MANKTYHSFSGIYKLFVVNCKWIKQKRFGIKSMSRVIGTLQKNSQFSDTDASERHHWH